MQSAINECISRLADEIGSDSLIIVEAKKEAAELAALRQQVAELRQAYIDVLDGNAADYEIRDNTGLSEERCRELSDLFYKCIREKKTAA